MKQFYLKIFFTAFVVFYSCNTFSQQILTDAAKRKALTDFANKLGPIYESNRKAAFDIALQKGWQTVTSSANGTIITLQGIDELGFPIYLKTYNNTTAAATTRTNAIQPGGSLGLNLSGASSFMANKMAIWDGGAVYTSHQEFAGKTITLKDNVGVVDHSTHVAGTMIAKGVYAPARGMAFGATTLLSYDYNNDATEMSIAAPNLLVSNHSYGYLAGWSLNDSNGHWEWYGLPGDAEDYKFGIYSTLAQTYDHIAYNAPKYLIVQAAGNNHGETGPAVGTVYYGYTSRTDQTIISKGPRPANISNNDSYETISTSANAKNILTVGAVTPLLNGPALVSDVQIASFSSWGPTDDGRIKPDICGDGVDVLSTGVSAPDAYLTFSGTSMATPNVSGSLYLLQEYYAQKNSGNFMLSSTLKGLVCHTAFDAGNPGPDYKYGWGLLDMAKAAQAITDNGSKSMVTEKVLSQGQTQTYTVTTSGNGPLIATIAWTDPEGSPTANGTLNDHTIKLVNDLDIRVSDQSTTFKPWILNPNIPSASATTGDNIRDNIEQVYIPGAIPGVNYTITVSHKGVLSSPQAYSLIVTGIGGTAYCVSAPASNADSRVNNVTLNDLNNTPLPGCTSYSNYTNLTASLEAGKTYPLNITLGTCGSNFNKIAKVFIDWNANGSFTDAGELVATSPTINATGSFTVNVTVPVNVVAGNYSLMRVVLSETSDPNTITPCGTYAKGETQDYRVKFLSPGIDVGITAINSPSTGSACPSANGSISVKVKNFGTNTISNIPVIVTITSPSAGTITLNETYTGTLAPQAEDDFTFAGTFNAVNGNTYTVTAATALAGDLIVGNNQTVITTTINYSAAPANLSAFYCNDAKDYTLSGTSDGQIFWYKNQADALPFAYGSPVVTTQAPVSNTYYAGVNDFSGNVGLVNKNVFPGGTYNQFTPYVIVNTKVPVIIKSARLYIGNPGKIVFSVTNANNGQVVSSATLNVTATRTTPLPGLQADDPADQGRVYNLNLQLPAAGTYNISVSFPDNATLFRNNIGVTGYPFTIGDIFSITGNSNVNTFYYYLYDVNVQSLGCSSPARVAVQITKPIITQNGLLLNSNFANNNQWYLNGVAISGAISQTYKPLRSGIYRVDATPGSGCISSSDDYSFVLPVTDGSDGAAISLAIFPVPTNGQLNLTFNAVKSNQLTISVLNVLGQIVYNDVRQITSGAFNTILNLSDETDGVYTIRLTIGDNTYIRKISIMK